MTTVQVTKGKVANDVIAKFIERHPLPDGQKRYPKGSKEDNAFIELYREQCGGEFHTNRGNIYKNSKETPDRLDQHARWHLGKVVDAIANPKPARAARSTKGETTAEPTEHEEHRTAVKHTGGARKKARRKTSARG